MISILNKIMDQIFREEMLSPKAIKSRTIKKMFSGENYDRLSISIPNRIKKKTTKYKKGKQCACA